MPELQTGQFFYSGDPLLDDRSDVRFAIGDTLANDPLLSDTEIDAAIAESFSAGGSAEHIGVAALTVATAAVAGQKTLTLSNAYLEDGATIAAGDAFTIAGQSQRYAIASTITASGNVLTDVPFWPALTNSVAAGAVITVRLFNVKLAAAICCEHLARRYAREADVSVDGRSISHSQKSRQFQALASSLRLQAARSGSVGPGIPVVRT